MIKKISAVLLALVLCLSVVVLPASAAGFADDYTLAEGKRIAYKLELDKASYNPGDTVTVKMYLYADSAIDLHTGSFLFAVNSALFDTTVNAANTVKATATSNAIYQSFYNDITALNWAWQAAAIKTRLQSASTEQENADYNEYLKIVLSRNTSGSHANAGLNTAGLTGSDVSADKDPFITFQLKLKDDIAPGTDVKVAITTGSILSTPAQTAFKVFADGSTKNVSPATSVYDVSAAVATATVGPETPAGPALAHQGRQVKMAVENGAVVSGTEQLRVVSAITPDDWKTYFANTTTTGATTNAIQEVGIVAFKGTAAAFDADTAKAVAQGTAAEGYSANSTDYIQNDTAGKTGMYLFGARIEYQSAVFDTTYLAYVKYLNADGQVAYAFYDTATIYSLNFAQDYTTITNGYIDWLGTQA